MTGLAAFALILRVACAAATEVHPLFPSYYYTDAEVIHSRAVAALGGIQAGRPTVINGSLGERVQTLLTLGTYRAAGPRPIAIKLLNALLGAAAVAAFAWTLTRAFSPAAAALAGLALALWPSHVFYTSQNLKEAPACLLAYAAFGALMAGFDPKAPRSRAAALAAAGFAALLGAGFYRSYILVGLAAALLGGIALAARKPPRANALLVAAAVLAALACYPTVSRTALSSFQASRLSDGDQGRIEPRLIPVAYGADSKTIDRPTSPQGISRFRRARQAGDRLWAKRMGGRDIGTQIYPDAELHTWLDLIFFLPKSAFTVLYMPLPGLYPLEGKPGRWAAAAENVLLLAISILAVAGLARGPKTPARIALLAFFAVMTAGAALLEFDLGSAGRHKLLYLPMLFPFAAEEAARLARGESA